MLPRRIAASALSQKGDFSGLCQKCAAGLRIRYVSTESIGAAATSSTTEDAQLLTSITPAPRAAYRIHASVILSRPPQITRDLDSFEKAFYLYQRRLNERLALPFTRYFYYAKGSPKLRDFQRKLKERKTAAHDIGPYQAYSRDGWNDELVVGARESEPEHQLEALLKNERPLETDDEAAQVTEEQEKILYARPSPRVTEADKAGDEKSLNRLLQRTLYLLVQDKDGQWRFPSAEVRPTHRESLRSGAEKALVDSAGTNMNTWILGNHPVGHLEQRNAKDHHETIKDGTQHVGDLVFFLRGHIMAGQADIKDNLAAVEDFKWLAKEEVAKLVAKRYWSAVTNILPER